MMNFTFTKDEVEEWEVENDTVMGGVSNSTVLHEEVDGEDCLRFSGHVSLENNGGFAQTIHTFSPAADISEATAVNIKGSGDGKVYKLRLETDAEKVAYSHEFTADESFDVTLQLSDFTKVHHGKAVPDKPDLDKSMIKTIGVLIGNGKEEDFELILTELKTVS